MKHNWIGTAKYPGKEPFSWGNVVAADPQEARERLKESFCACVPAQPPDFEPQRGILLLQLEDE